MLLRHAIVDIGPLASERHQILQFQGEFSTQTDDNITELVKIFKYEKL
jgi:hypothetical protein